MAGEAGRDGAVEDVEAEGDAAEQVVDLADPEQVLGRRLGQERRGEGEDRRHLLLVAAEGAADREPVDPAAAIASADSRRRSSWVPPWTIPKRACRAGPFSSCQATQRSSQRWVRSVERAV